MDTEARTLKLLQAATLIEEVAKDLDSSVTECNCCGSKRYNHYGEYKAHIELEGIATKTRKWAGNIDRGLNKVKDE